MPKKTFKCSQCNRTFTRPGPFAWHMQSMHGAKKRKTAKKAKRRSVRRKKKRAGRPKGVASRLGLGSMSLEQLSQVIDAARSEARRKLAALEEAIG